MKKGRKVFLAEKKTWAKENTWERMVLWGRREDTRYSRFLDPNVSNYKIMRDGNREADRVDYA